MIGIYIVHMNSYVHIFFSWLYMYYSHAEKLKC